MILEIFNIFNSICLFALYLQSRFFKKNSIFAMFCNSVWIWGEFKFPFGSCSLLFYTMVVATGHPQPLARPPPHAARGRNPWPPRPSSTDSAVVCTIIYYSIVVSASERPSVGYPRVVHGSDEPAGRVGSRFCRILAGRVSTSDF